MRRVGGWLLVFLGLAGVALGTAAAVAFGPDDSLTLGPHQLSTSSAVLITAPSVLPYSGPTLRVTATTDEPTESVFVGVGHDVDVRDYLSETAYTRLDKVSLPWRTVASEVSGQDRPRVAPAVLDWWLASASGRARATVSLPVPATAVDVVIINGDFTPGLATEVTVSIVLEGAFLGGLGLLLGGIGLLVAAWLLLRQNSTPRRRPPPVSSAPATSAGGP
jgi:hypothetical protein